MRKGKERQRDYWHGNRHVVLCRSEGLLDGQTEVKYLADR